MWWLATIVLGVLFLAGTAYEWHDLITHEGLTISRNLFGTTFYTLVGFHALHVTGGVIAMSIVLGAGIARPNLGQRIISARKWSPGIGILSTRCGSSCSRSCI